MSRLRRRGGSKKRVRVGVSDGSLTGAAGLVAVTELVERLGVAASLDRHIGPMKQRNRGLSGGQLLMAVTLAQLLGEDCLAGLDRLRGDAAGQLLSPVPTPPSTTAGSLARRFDPDRIAGIETGLAQVTARWLELLPAGRRAELVTRRPTIDLDSTDVEVYGRDKDGVAYNYQGQRCGRPHLASWSEASLPLAAELLAGNDDVRPRAAGLLRRALAALPSQVCAMPRVRADAGYFSAELAQAAVKAGCDFAIAAKRNSACWRALAAVPDDAWTPARDMTGAEVAACDYTPAGWPRDTYTIIGRVRLETAGICSDSRSRRRRTIDPDQLTLALDGKLDHVYAVSFLVTNLPVSTPADVVAVEAWFRGRVNIEERFREAKLGAALRHLPSADKHVNEVWTWSALLAGAISVMLQSLSGLDGMAGRARSPRLRYELLHTPARSSGTPAASPCGCRPDPSCYRRSSPRSERCPDRPDRPAHPHDQDQEPPPGAHPEHRPAQSCFSVETKIDQPNPHKTRKLPADLGLTSAQQT